MIGLSNINSDLELFIMYDMINNNYDLTKEEVQRYWKDRLE